ncbi:MAG TPA: phosphomannose isomerase type II C-terminal cupin domain [Candidatus Paceibacterota bacterium]
MQPITVEKPWGEFREFAINEPATVKILSVNKGQEFSLQKHEHRGEFWRVLSGHPDVVIGDKMYKGKKGDEFTAQVGVTHRIAAPEDDVEILEISRGEFDEDDIVRLEDKYGRS